jgi:hypothetical protein
MPLDIALNNHDGVEGNDLDIYVRGQIIALLKNKDAKFCKDNAELNCKLAIGMEERQLAFAKAKAAEAEKKREYAKLCSDQVYEKFIKQYEEKTQSKSLMQFIGLRATDEKGIEALMKDTDYYKKIVNASKLLKADMGRRRRAPLAFLAILTYLRGTKIHNENRAHIFEKIDAQDAKKKFCEKYQYVIDKIRKEAEKKQHKTQVKQGTSSTVNALDDDGYGGLLNGFVTVAVSLWDTMSRSKLNGPEMYFGGYNKMKGGTLASELQGKFTKLEKVLSFDPEYKLSANIENEINNIIKSKSWKRDISKYIISTINTNDPKFSYFEIFKVLDYVKKQKKDTKYGESEIAAAAKKYTDFFLYGEANNGYLNLNEKFTKDGDEFTLLEYVLFGKKATEKEEQEKQKRKKNKFIFWYFKNKLPTNIKNIYDNCLKDQRLQFAAQTCTNETLQLSQEAKRILRKQDYGNIFFKDMENYVKNENTTELFKNIFKPDMETVAHVSYVNNHLEIEKFARENVSKEKTTAKGGRKKRKSKKRKSKRKKRKSKRKSKKRRTKKRKTKRTKKRKSKRRRKKRTRRR